MNLRKERLGHSKKGEKEAKVSFHNYFLKKKKITHLRGMDKPNLASQVSTFN